MLLLIDAGNTRIKWALAADGAALGEWLDSGAVTHPDLNHLPASWRQRQVTRVIVSNVAGPRIRDQLQLMLRGAPITWFASSAQRAGVRNGYRTPSQLGCDRFAAAIGAHALEPGKALVVATCGSCAVFRASELAIKPKPGRIIPPLKTPSAPSASMVVAVPQVATTSGLPGSSACAPIAAAKRSQPSWDGVR
jgi:type III pantothenate kinase